MIEIRTQRDVRSTMTAVQAGQLDIMTSVTATAVEGLKQVAELHLNVTQASLQQAHFSVRQFTAASHAGDRLKVATAQVKPGAERVMDYAYCLGKISAATQIDMVKLISEASTVILKSSIAQFRSVFSAARDDIRSRLSEVPSRKARHRGVDVAVTRIAYPKSATQT